jgi:plastocyanin
VIGPLIAILVTACSSPGSAPTSASAASLTASVTATGALVNPGAPSSAEPQVPSVAPPPTAPATTRPSATPAPKPTATLRPATPVPSTPAPAPVRAAIRISDFAFAPVTITVRVGSGVTWTNRQAEVQHTVTADDGSFASAPLSTSGSFTHMFTIVGTYAYHCSIHPEMTGRVVVTG